MSAMPKDSGTQSVTPTASSTVTASSSTAVTSCASWAQAKRVHRWATLEKSICEDTPSDKGSGTGTGSGSGSHIGAWLETSGGTADGSGAADCGAPTYSARREWNASS